MRMLILATALAGFVLPAMAQDFYTSQRHGNVTTYNGDVTGTQVDNGRMSTFQGQVNGQDRFCSTYRGGGITTTNCN